MKSWRLFWNPGVTANMLSRMSLRVTYQLEDRLKCRSFINLFALGSLFAQHLLTLRKMP